MEFARTVAAFLGEPLDTVFMGPGYFTLFPNGVREDNDWLNILKRRNWIAAT
ncbi:MAG TPA: hypothetical protein VFN10_20720 [Thermoanaerobaculia bacterium]|nr:hypothetical protein [Thermoanaerobaculia bacterium]